MRALAPSLVWAPGGQRGWGREAGGLGSGAVTSRSRGPRAGRAGWDSQLPGPIQTCWSPTLLLAQGNWARPGGMHWRGWGAGAGQAVAVLLRGPQGWGYDIGAPLCPPSGPGSGWPEPVPDQSAPPWTSVSPSEKQDRLLIRSDSLAGLWNPEPCVGGQRRPCAPRSPIPRVGCPLTGKPHSPVTCAPVPAEPQPGL